jgi:D-glycero-D-manno-heptose 1,7-bisphosphate phosphatase
MPQALILVGGQGTRLGPLTAALPKPMLDIGGRPFIDRLPCSLETDILPRLAAAQRLARIDFCFPIVKLLDYAQAGASGSLMGGWTQIRER